MIFLLIGNRVVKLKEIIVCLGLSQFCLSALACSLPGQLSHSIGFYQLVNSSVLIFTKNKKIMGEDIFQATATFLKDYQNNSNVICSENPTIKDKKWSKF